jgi:5-methyltetrahydrofolate--homocysteine methyltransferase
MLEGGGFQVLDLGTDVPVERFVAAAQQEQADVVGLSALLTTTMPRMGETIQALRGAGIASRVMIGGAPVTQSYADSIGADGYAADAASAVDLARKLLGKPA